LPSLSWCPFEPAAKYCTPAASKPCTATSDVECVLCPVLAAFELVHDGADGSAPLCVPCKLGYIFNESEPLMGRRCVPCPVGFYCPSKDQIMECPGSFTYIADPMTSRTVRFPTTAEGAWSMQQCSCNSVGMPGGFEVSSYSQALFGCVPCSNGTYASPGMERCQPCPTGTYARQDWMVNVPGGKGRVQGASSCRQCPSDRPYTWDVGGSSEDDCKTCPENHFMQR
jgi:hypothetical protein